MTHHRYRRDEPRLLRASNEIEKSAEAKIMRANANHPHRLKLVHSVRAALSVRQAEQARR